MKSCVQDLCDSLRFFADEYEECAVKVGPPIKEYYCGYASALRFAIKLIVKECHCK